MASFKVLLCIALGLLALSCRQIDADCNICSTKSYAACVNETSFAICYDGKTMSDQYESCDAGEVCTDDPGVCQTKTDTIVLGCPDGATCGTCQASATFACVTQTQFAFCAADGSIGHVSTCQDGRVCSLDYFASNADICAPSCVATPTCASTAPVEKDWKDTCNTTSTAGYYINIYDATCKTYVYCEQGDTGMISIKYDCGTSYFDVAAKKCTTAKPATCT